MGLSLRRTSAITAVLVLGIGLSACSSSKTKTNTSASTPTTAAAASISATSFTSDFSAMAQLKSLAAQGKGKIGVLLPDTTTSARYVNFDAPYLAKALQAAGLTTSDFKVDNAQGKASTMQTQAEADITAGASVP